MSVAMSNYTFLETTLKDLACRLIPGYGCSNSTLQTGLDCNSYDNTVDYNCVLNIDVQNETSYSCNSCLNNTLDSLSNNTLCGAHFKLNLVTIIFESALKSLWLKLPYLDTCDYEYDTLTCYNDGVNRTLYIDASETSANSTVYESFQCSWNYNNRSSGSVIGSGYDWSFLFVIVFIVAGGLGNILVCLAVCLDKRLQNVTNYFLLSLAIADLLVSLFVMPMGAIPGFLGYWPLGFVWCNVYVTCDVLACSASIMHMCFISIGRYLGIRNPLKSRHHSTKRVVAIKIALVWLLSMFVSSSITVLGLINKTNIMPTPEMCVINNRLFWIFGSLVAFYIPMLMMVVSFALTVQLLKRQAKLAATPVPGGIQRRYPDVSHHFLPTSTKMLIIRERKKSRPKLPDNFNNIGKLLEKYEPANRIYRTQIVVSAKSSAVIFGSVEIMDRLNDCPEIYVDATLKCVPKGIGANQLLILHMNKMNMGMATVFVLCSNQTTELYSSIWTFLLGWAPGLRKNLKYVITDFERSLMMSVKETMPWVTIRGCWFHFTKALSSHWQDYGLKNVSSALVQDILSLTWVLPLLPVEYFAEAIELYRQKAREVEPKYQDAVYKFLDYLENHWLKIAEVVSLWRSSNRTNNICESFHGGLLKRLGHHPNLLVFIDKLASVISDIEATWRQLEHDGIAVGLKRQKQSHINSYINCQQIALLFGKQCGGFDNGPMHVRRAGAKSSPDLSPGTSVSRQLTWRVTSTRPQRNKIGMSVSHPQLSYMNGCGTGAGSGGSKRGRDVATQTPPSIAAETRRARLRPLKITLAAPNALTLRFLANRKKGRSLSANAVANEQKATKVLGLVFFTFVLCWAPFFLLNILFAACPACIVPEHVVDICLWLGYVSSTINPIIYTVFNRTFRAAFLRLLRCHCSRRGGCTRYRSVGSTRGASQLCARSALPLAISLRPTTMPTTNPAASEQTEGVMMETAMGDYNVRY